MMYHLFGQYFTLCDSTVDVFSLLYLRLANQNLGVGTWNGLASQPVFLLLSFGGPNDKKGWLARL